MSGKGIYTAIEWGYQSIFWPWSQSTSMCYIRQATALVRHPASSRSLVCAFDAQYQNIMGSQRKKNNKMTQWLI